MLDEHAQAQRSVQMALSAVTKLGMSEPSISPRRGAYGQICHWLEDCRTWLEDLAAGRMPSQDQGGDEGQK
jgi:hypothetical protein